MTAKNNITVAIEAGLLEKARAVARRRGLSVSALLASVLRELVDEDSRYMAAKKRALGLFATPLALGGTPLSREAAHTRPLTKRELKTIAKLAGGPRGRSVRSSLF